MERQEDLRVIKTRRLIKNALIELMAEKEVAAITITELSAKALINRKTFYRHYETVAEVVTELENEILSEFAEALRNANKSCLDVGGVVSDISALIVRRRDYFAKMTKLNPELFSKGRIKAMLRRAVEVSLRNYGGITDRETLAAVSQFAVSGVLSLYAEWFDNGCHGSLDFVTDVCRRMLTSGLSAYVEADKLADIKL
ncbi:MAG: TetR/AcrR family transcriptional regulator [Oscillospiraceae bacterium]|nr:TetR/AcrR family transcriptional regulator [Oscillospiraceae bacterium]